MSKLIRNTLCVAALGMGVSLAYFAWATAPDGEEEPPPPPPSSLNDCSPGFWKNHTEYWIPQYCADACAADVLADLTSRGQGSDQLRHDAAADLNSWADGYYKAKICTD